LRILAEFAQVSVRQTVADRIEPLSQVLVSRDDFRQHTVFLKNDHPEPEGDEGVPR